MCFRFEVLPAFCVKIGVFLRRDAVHFGSYYVCVSAEAAFFHPLSSYKPSDLVRIYF